MIVDIHNHILYGVDDGPQNINEMILLATQAVEQGVDHVIATPHHKHNHKNHFYETSCTEIFSKVKELNTILKHNKIPLVVHPGIEFHLHEDIKKDIENNIEEFLTLNDTGKYLLIELPCSFLPEHTEETLYTLQNKGFIPILAHPERNRILRSNPAKIYNLVRNGILVQITAGSITGVHGKRLKNFSLHLLDHDLVHVVASDAHHYSRRKFELVDSYQIIEKLYSQEYVETLQKNAVHVLNGANFKIPEPKIIGKRRQYFFLYNHPLNQMN